MTQQEFTTRTKVEVSTSEFEAINVVYNNSDLNKDEFCAMWRKMNASRVQKAVEEMRWAKVENMYRNRLFKLFEGIKIAIDRKKVESWAEAQYTDAEERTLYFFGISTMDEFTGRGVDYSTLRYRIGQKLGICE